MAAKDSKAGRQDKDESVDDDDEVSQAGRQAAASKTKTKTRLGLLTVGAAVAGVAVAQRATLIGAPNEELSHVWHIKMERC